jgi:lysine 2,3-aminomutase
LRNYEGVITTYKEPDSYEPIFCDRNCGGCALQLKMEEADEVKAVGIEKLLTDANDEISLVPNGNTRLERRAKNS